MLIFVNEIPKITENCILRLNKKYSMKRILSVLSFALLLASCEGDDGLDFEVVPPLLLADVIIEDEAEIVEYLQTHFYNYEEFANPPANFDFRIVLDTIAGDNADRTPLINQVESRTVTISSSDFLLDDEEEDIPHTYYILSAREGLGANPTFADSTFVRFQGQLLDGQIFDEVTTIAAFDLATFQQPGFGGTRAFRGVGEGIQQIRAGNEIIDNPDGTFEIPGSGIGMVIFPSGLGTFNGIRSPIPQYAPLIFTFEVLATTNADHDGDGIPSFMEDVDGDGLVFNDNTDSGTETFGIFPNYLDPDDDNDGISTSEEIIINADGTITFPDSDGDGTPDYLDNDTN